MNSYKRVNGAYSAIIHSYSISDSKLLYSFIFDSEVFIILSTSLFIVLCPSLLSQYAHTLVDKFIQTLV